MTAPKKRKKRKLKIGNLILLIVLILILIFGFMYFNNQRAVSKKDDTPIEFVIDYGTSTKQVIKQLKEKHLIRDANLGYIYFKLNNFDSLKAGKYTLSKSMDLKTMLNTLGDSKAALQDVVNVTIVEGDWAKHIASKIAEQTNVSETELIDLWNDKEWLTSIMDDYPFLSDAIFAPNIRIKLEGYLAPNTYQFYKETTAKDVTIKILDQTKKEYEQLEPLINKSKLSVSEIYTLASIVQFEAGKVDDMKLIAGVFYNRLKIDMPLQSSVTVCYAIDYNKTDDWQKCEFNSNYDSPYNTYKHRGLPPGPIENPGLDALKAVLEPTESDYYYFMADVKGDGTVYYAKTLDEHNANVRKYLK